MAVEYYVMHKSRRGTLKKLRTCETSEQAVKFIREMPSAKERSECYVQYSADAIAAYNERMEARG